jgi:hypothetical protein
MESYEQCGQGQSYCSLCTLYTIHRLVFVTRLIINKINKVQWVDFKLENDLVSLHSLKTMGLSPFGASASLFLRNGELLGHFPIHISLTITITHLYITYHYYYTLISLTITITHLYHLPLLLHTYISLTITITHLYITYHYYYTLISLTITITHLYHSPLITHGSIYIYRCSDLFSKLVCVQLFWQQRIISSYLNRLLKMRSG